jgi:hypothetical protein
MGWPLTGQLGLTPTHGLLTHEPHQLLDDERAIRFVTSVKMRVLSFAQVAPSLKSM